MRVRKSTSDSYKTALSSIVSPYQFTMAATLHVKAPREPVPNEYVHQRELLPFCGLPNIDGYAEQPTTNLHLYGATDSRATNLFPLPAEAFTQPFSNPLSTRFSSPLSSQSRPNPLNLSKRSWQDEEEEKSFVPSFFFSMKNTSSDFDDDIPVSPLSETPPPRSIHVMPAPRRFEPRQVAQPKSRRVRQRTTQGESEDMDMDHEKESPMEGRVAAGCGSDFEEADFLGREVAMSGV